MKEEFSESPSVILEGPLQRFHFYRPLSLLEIYAPSATL